MRARAFQAALLCGLSALACEDVSGLNGVPSMDPGQNCMQCHIAGGQASGRQWTVAGTVFPTPTSPGDGGLPNAEVLLEDSASPPKALTLITDDVGNFYTAETFTGAVRVAVQYRGQRYQMQEAPPTGACNLCHDIAPTTTGQEEPVPLPAPYSDAGFNYGSSAPGRLFVPITPVTAGDGGSL